jgi:hypothetical protein
MFNRQHNALRVIAAIRDLRLPLRLQVLDITSPCPPFMVLLCLALFERLPGYLPCGNQIVFKSNDNSEFYLFMSIRQAARAREANC